LSREELLALIPALKLGLTYMGHRKYALIVTSRRIVAVDIGPLYSRRDKARILLKSIVGGLIGYFTLGGLPGFVGGSAAFSSLDEEPPQPPKLMRGISRIMGRPRFEAPLSSVVRVEVKRKSSTVKIKCEGGSLKLVVSDLGRLLKSLSSVLPPWKIKVR